MIWVTNNSLGSPVYDAYALTRLIFVTDTDEAALYDVVQGVATITLNRPDNKNALSVELVNSIGDHFQTAQNDEKVRAILFTNNGNTFCAGH